MKRGIWKDEEVKDLFQYVEETKNKNQPLKMAFVLHAKKYGRQPNSVRNYYYHEVDNLASDTKRAGRLNIDIKNHEKSEISYFSQEEEQGLMQRIEELVAAGNSVRKACLILSDGDIDKMLRYQNKYRNYLVKNKKQADEKSNIIKFTKKKNDALTDNDITSLFMGLVRLVKRSAMEEAAGKLKEERSAANNMLRKAIVDLSKKEREIKNLKEEFAKLKAENLKLLQSMMKARCDKAGKLNKRLQEKTI